MHSHPCVRLPLPATAINVKNLSFQSRQPDPLERPSLGSPAPRLLPLPLAEFYSQTR